MTLIIRKRSIQHIPVLEVVSKKLMNEPLPLVVYYHGWQTKKELALTAAKKIANHNIRVVLPDSMYHGERKIKSPSVIPSFTFWSTIQYNISEFPLIIYFYTKRNLIKHSSLGVAGFSMGGMTTSALLTHYPEIKAASILMGTTNFKLFISRTQDFLAQETNPYSLDIKDILSWTNKYDLNTMPEKIAQRPLYIWHGTEDQKLPYNSIEQFFYDNKDKTHGKNMQFDTGIGEPHILKINTMEKTGAFFDQHLKN